MAAELKLGRLWRTVRPLRREQVLGRITHELRQRAFRKVPALLPWWLGPAAAPPVALRLPAPSPRDAARLEAARRVVQTGRALLAGHEVPIRAWGDAGLPKLVRYHLHYLDAARELAWAGAALDAADLREQGLALVEDWSRDNPARGSEGWEPYAVAARLQNLACMVGLWGSRAPEWLCALMVLHARYLNAWPETHLQANHLLKDWVSLALAGLVFDGPEAAGWRERGLEEVRRELDEQLLPDGGHYERSPMYHLLVLGDLLDLRDFTRARGLRLEWLEGAAVRMAQLAVEILHPDGEIPLFNDAVIGQAPSPAALFARMDEPVRCATGSVFDAPHFGLSVLRGEPGETLIVDTGPLGPAHQPGHAHSDTLSYELSVKGVRCAVNSGMDGYQSPRRAYFRSAAAHNTVTVDGEGPDELWSAFRVGGRATLLSRTTYSLSGTLVLRAALRAFQGWTHLRTLVLAPRRALIVLDEVCNAPQGATVVSRVMLPPQRFVRFQPLHGEQVTPLAAPYAPRFGTTTNVTEQAVAMSGTRSFLGYALLWGTLTVEVEVCHPKVNLKLDSQSLTLELR